MSASRESTPAIAPDGRPGAIARVVDVVVDPRAAFREIAEKPSWLAALLTVVVVRLISLFAFYQPDASPGKLLAGIAFQFATITPMLLAATTLLWVSGHVWGVGFGWRSGFSIAVHVYLAYTIVTIAVASVAAATLPASVEVDLREPPFVNLRDLADPAQSPTLARLLGEADVRSVYALILVAVGITAAHPSASTARIVGVVASCFAVRVMVATWLPG